MTLKNRIRRLLGLRPILTLYVQRDNELSALVTRTVRTEATKQGWLVKERRL